MAFSIESSRVKRLTKKELIEAIDRTFPNGTYVKDEYVMAVAVETTLNHDGSVKQSIHFTKNLIL